MYDVFKDIYKNWAFQVLPLSILRTEKSVFPYRSRSVFPDKIILFELLGFLHHLENFKVRMNFIIIIMKVIKLNF